ncbi:MAG: DnaJ C-terminal domain-containing protein [Pseudomonadota bacterium]
MQYVDYYKVLGVSRSAKPEQISKAYKDLARKHHPDLNKAPGSEEKLKEINEAYEVLKDAEKRKRYDQLGANWKHGAQFNAPPEWGGFSGGFSTGGTGFSDFFQAFFGGTGGGRRGQWSTRVGLDDIFGGFGNGGEEASPSLGRDIESSLTVELEDIYHGRKRTISLKGPQGEKRYDVKVPKGIREGEKIRLSGQGEAGQRGEGDLYLQVKVAPHPIFRVEGDNLVVDLEVPVWDVALGARVPVPTLEGSVQMTLPAGQAGGQRLRLKGKGLPRKDGTKGDLLAQLKITVPAKLTEEQKRLFVALKDSSSK